MKLVTYRSGEALLPGVLQNEYVYDLNIVLSSVGAGISPTLSVRDFLEKHGSDLQEISGKISQAIDGEVPAAVGKFTDVALAQPVPDPRKILCVGLNYSDHVAETGRQLPQHPDVFAKFDSSLIGPMDDISVSDVTSNLDFEGEVAIVIGKPCRDVSPADALSYVAGLTVLNDITARDLQYRGTQWLAGKAVDGSTPCGPALVTLDEIREPQSLDLETRVNGEVMQASNTRYMIFKLNDIVSYISKFLELSPGDIIATGTPQGIGAKRQPPVWLKRGDVVEVDVQTIGTLRNIIR